LDFTLPSQKIVVLGKAVWNKSLGLGGYPAQAQGLSFLDAPMHRVTNSAFLDELEKIAKLPRYLRTLVERGGDVPRTVAKRLEASKAGKLMARDISEYRKITGRKPWPFSSVLDRSKPSTYPKSVWKS